MEFHLIHGKGRDFHFPIPFREFEFNMDGTGEKIILLNFGEINKPGIKSLREITLSGFFPAQNYSYCQVKPLEPMEYIDTIIRLKDGKAVCIFIITETNVNFQCTLENFTYGMNDGTKDIYFELTLREYRPLR